MHDAKTSASHASSRITNVLRRYVQVLENFCSQVQVLVQEESTSVQVVSTYHSVKNAMDASRGNPTFQTPPPSSVEQSGIFTLLHHDERCNEQRQGHIDGEVI
jgi:hypothetical protein